MIGTYPVSAGSRAALRLVVYLLALGSVWTGSGAISWADVDVGVQVRYHGTQTFTDSVKLIVVDAAAAEAKFETQAKPEEEVTLRLPENRLWELRVAAEGIWSDESVFLSAPDLGSVVVDLYPSTTFSGRLTSKGGAKEAADLRVRFRSSRQEAGVEDAKANCEVQPGGRFQCTVPALTLDLKLRVPGFASAYLWSLELDAENPLDLGEIQLEAGASVVGTVETVDGTPVGADTRVRLVPAQAGGVVGNEQSRLALLEDVLDAGPDGFFHFTGIPAGSYRLIASQQGFAPVRLGPITILAGSESEIRQPLVLPRPLTLKIAVDPPQTPGAQPWQLEILAENPSFPGSLHAVVPRHPVPPSGNVELNELTPADYSVRLLDENESVYLHDWIYIEEDTSLTLAPGLVRVQGEVLLGDEPLGATLWFGGRSGEERIALSSDEVGWYEGVLPRGGEWRVDVHSDLPRVRRNLHVEVEGAQSSTPERLDLELSDFSLAGEIVDQTGAVVKGRALVTAWKVGADEQEMLQYFTEGDGTFEFRGLEKDRYRLSAHGKLEGKPASSESITVTATEGAWGPTLELVLRETETLSGSVLGPNGPVPLARLQVRPLTGGRVRTQFWPEAVTDVQGRFRVEVPAGTDQAEILVFAPGRELKAFTERGPFDDIALQVGLLGGTIHLKRHDPGESSVQPLLIQDGKLIGPTAFERWSRDNGIRVHDQEPLVIPLMSPGEYWGCLLTPREMTRLGWTLSFPDLSQCVRGYLQPNGVLDLELIEPAAD